MKLSSNHQQKETTRHALFMCIMKCNHLAKPANAQVFSNRNTLSKHSILSRYKKKTCYVYVDFY